VRPLGKSRACNNATRQESKEMFHMQQFNHFAERHSPNMLKGFGLRSTGSPTGGSGMQPQYNQHWRKRSDLFDVMQWTLIVHVSASLDATTQSGYVKTVWLHNPAVRWVADGGRLLRGGQQAWPCAIAAAVGAMAAGYPSARHFLHSFFCRKKRMAGPGCSPGYISVRADALIRHSGSSLCVRLPACRSKGCVIAGRDTACRFFLKMIFRIRLLDVTTSAVSPVE
jgi:hypothetical protein